MSRKFALVIGNGEYQDEKLGQLNAPKSDVKRLSGLLSNPQIGAFDESIAVVNQSEAALRRLIARFYSDRSPDDLLLLYFSGHGVVDEDGRLYLAAKDTERDSLSATAISATFVSERMDRSRCKRQILILDCCHSGAFARGAKGVPGTSVGTATAFEGAGLGRIVLTATDALQYAWDGDRLTGSGENSLFTHYLITGLETGEADIDGDGQITVDELYNFVYDRIILEKRRQTPCKWAYGQQGEIILANNPVPIRPATLPDDLLHAIASPFVIAREQAVGELERLLASKSKPLAQAAAEALAAFDKDDSRKVSAAASAALAAVSPGGAASDPRAPRIKHVDPKASHLAVENLAAEKDRKSTTSSMVAETIQPDPVLKLGLKAWLAPVTLTSTGWAAAAVVLGILFRSSYSRVNWSYGYRWDGHWYSYDWLTRTLAILFFFLIGAGGYAIAFLQAHLGSWKRVLLLSTACACSITTPILLLGTLSMENVGAHFMIVAVVGAAAGLMITLVFWRLEPGFGVGDFAIIGMAHSLGLVAAWLVLLSGLRDQYDTLVSRTGTTGFNGATAQNNYASALVLAGAWGPIVYQFLAVAGFLAGTLIGGAIFYCLRSARLRAAGRHVAIL